MAVLSTSYDVESGKKTTLKNTINKVQTTGIIINTELNITKGVLNFDAETSKEEWVSFGSTTLNGDGTTTLGDVVRGLNTSGDTFTGDSSRAFPHSGGVCVVELVDYHSLFNLKANKDRDNTMSGNNTFTKILGFSGSEGQLQPPRLTTTERDALSGVQNGTIIYNTTVGEEQLYNGGNWYSIALGSTQPNASETLAGKSEEATQTENDSGASSGGTGADLFATPNKNAKTIQKASWIFATSTGSANAYVLTLTPAPTALVAGMLLAFKANFANTDSCTVNVNSLGAVTIKKRGDQDCARGDIKNGQIVMIQYDGTNFQMVNPSGALAELLAGIANATTTDKYALSYNGNGRLDLADANDAGLNTEWLFAGIAMGASTSGNAQAYTPPGQIVDIPTFTLSDRQNCRLWNGETQATSNVTTDTITVTTAWRAQTFTPSTGQDNVSRVLVNITNSSLSATMQCSIYATSGGQPTGAALASATALTSFASGDLTFDFATPLSVTPGTVYAIVVRLSAYTSGNFAWNYQNTNPYSGGTRLTSSDSGVNWSIDSASDMRFKVQYRGMFGESVYLSDTAGQLTLVPGTYSNEVGHLISASQMVLKTPAKAIYATFNGTFDPGGASGATTTTTTDITVGFRARLVICKYYFGGTPPTTPFVLTAVATAAAFSGDYFHVNANLIGSFLLRKYGASFAAEAFGGVPTATTISDQGGANDDMFFTLSASWVDSATYRISRALQRQSSSSLTLAGSWYVYLTFIN